MSKLGLKAVVVLIFAWLAWVTWKRGQKLLAVICAVLGGMHLEDFLLEGQKNE